MTSIARLFCLLSAILIGSAAHADAPAPGTERDIAELARSILALGPQVDPEEAQRAARVTYEHTYQLAQEYQITDGPLVHNTKVNMGIKPRGLCWHWAEDIEARLKKERFTTLDLHRTVANAFNIRLEHSTTIISAKGEPFEDGIVLDPWRKGGELFWAPTVEDRRYKWMARDEVFAKKRAFKKLKTKGKPGTTTMVNAHK